MVPTSHPNICKVVDNLHMLWMGIWVHHQANFITCIGQELGSLLKLWFNAGLQMTLLCSGWGSNPTWNGSNISSQHLRGAWQASYAVDGHMAPYSAHYHYHYHHLSCPRFGRSSEILVHCWAANDTIVQWLRFLPNMEWFPHPLPTYARWLTSFICCGWAYGSIIRPCQLCV